ncbi:MAG: DoxX family protein [Gemmatimonadetes bacterium]|nr:DoxX family protein [Gemmatimonadota bacterium]
MTDKAKAGKLTTVVSIVLALLFLFQGVTKLGGMMVEQFGAWGYPAWFQYLIGVAETAGGVGLLVKKTRSHAAAAMFVVMLGAIFTLLRAGQMGQVAVPIIVLLLAAFVARNSR